ncbi:MAG: DNA-directed RNA polymerase subunit beta', partial [Candidatus Heimdallarchaeota archaeon]|nr:DNA-directed RNA polymerase subunit beta' [Candidatus Heimdallarchaeota archaeon]
MSINSNSIATSDFDSMRIFILSADEVRAMSYGEVTKPETVNYRTLKPENGGLFCCKIFGPLRNDECLCGKYRGSRYRGTTCEKCGVEITSSRVRRMRMGHIELAAPVSHIWFLKSLPSRISLLLNIPLKNIERVLYFECHIVIDSGLSPFNVGDLLEEHELVNAYKEYGRDSFIAKIGSPAIQTMLANLNLVELCESLRNDLEITSSEIKRKKIIKRLRLIEDFIKSGNNPQDMIMNVLPVISPDLRPLMMLDGGRFVSSDQNDLYRYVINRNNRLHSLIGMNALEMVLSSEKRLLQEAVDALFDNGRRGKMLRSTNKRAYKSLTDSLKGKNGRFRQNLLGKRVDFSGRSVIVVGPSLKLHQCGLPKIMALEMFKPFIYSKLQLYGMVPTIKSAKRMVQNEDPAIWDVLEKVIHEHLVLLNRAPTLHRLGIQAFEPILIEGNAIQLHPLVCSAFNADFDGDQMAVHLPLSLEAQIESRVLMMSVNNILGPSNGKPIIIPSKDIVLGLYYLSLMDDEEESDNTDGNDEIYISTYLDLNEILYALEDKIISLHSPIRCRVPSKYKDDKSYSIEKTTAGRFILYDAIPENSNIKFSIINDVMNTKNITNLVDMVYRNCGQNTTVVFSDKLKEMGF